MPSLLAKSFNLCFSIIRRPQIALDIPSLDDLSRPSASSTTATSSNTYIKNYNSLYDFSSATPAPAQAVVPSIKSLPCFQVDDPSPSSSSSSSSYADAMADDIAAATPDFATVYASQRFFFSSPGRSNSIIDSSSSSSSFLESQPENDSQVAAGGFAVQTYSPDPYVDFRRSMQEMVEARELLDVKANWDYLHELLLCYLSLNPKSTHKFIIRAFADLLVSLISTANGGGGGIGGGGSGQDCQLPGRGNGGIDGGCSCN
ncbi:hypothetical protein Ancab_022310 [Ancistrocladus abbreviatus]